MKRIFWVLALGALASAAMAVGLGRAADVRHAPSRVNGGA
jgi:hypothetical protein